MAKTTLNLWIFEGEETFLPALEAAFEDAHPDIDLKITEIPEDNYSTKIDTALAADSPPDVGFIVEPRWIKAGRMLPLDDIIESEGIDLSNLNQNAFDGCEYEGKIYCLGSYSAATMLFYNKDLFDAAGLSYPSSTESMSVDEYAALAAQLTQPSDDLSTTGLGRRGRDTVLVDGHADPFQRGRSDDPRLRERCVDRAHVRGVGGDGRRRLRPERVAVRSNWERRRSSRPASWR